MAGVSPLLPGLSPPLPRCSATRVSQQPSIQSAPLMVKVTLQATSWEAKAWVRVSLPRTIAWLE